MEKQSLIKANAIAFLAILIIQLLKFYDIGNHFFVMLFTSMHDFTYVLLLECLHSE